MLTAFSEHQYVRCTAQVRRLTHPRACPEWME